MPRDYFELLGLEKSFDIDLAKLNANYFAAQQKAHPDKSGESDDAARLNEAYGTLKNKFRRLGYLVEISGHKDLAADQALLMEMMELREEYEGSPDKTAEKIRKQIDVLLQRRVLLFRAIRLMIWQRFIAK